jgi:hypothetical protein
LKKLQKLDQLDDLESIKNILYVICACVVLILIILVYFFIQALKTKSTSIRKLNHSANQFYDTLVFSPEKEQKTMEKIEVASNNSYNEYYDMSSGIIPVSDGSEIVRDSSENPANPDWNPIYYPMAEFSKNSQDIVGSPISEREAIVETKNDDDKTVENPTHDDPLCSLVIDVSVPEWL